MGTSSMSPLFTPEANRVWVAVGMEAVLRFIGWLNENLPAAALRKDLEKRNCILTARLLQKAMLFAGASDWHSSFQSYSVDLVLVHC